MGEFGYGHDHFILIDGVRHRTRLVRSLLPALGETNGAFERRMDELAQQARQLAKVVNVSYSLERRNGSIVSCELCIDHEPYPEFIKDDDTPAGGRPGTPRGKRA